MLLYVLPSFSQDGGIGKCELLRILLTLSLPLPLPLPLIFSIQNSLRVVYVPVGS